MDKEKNNIIDTLYNIIDPLFKIGMVGYLLINIYKYGILGFIDEKPFFFFLFVGVAVLYWAVNKKGKNAPNSKGKNKIYPCKYCKEEFDYKLNRNAHEWKCEERTYVCKKCKGKGTITKGYFTCNDCGRKIKVKE